MPLYEYRCPRCGHHTELIQPLRAKPPRGCKECGFRGELKKAISAPAFHLKGSGWYVTDYGKGGKKKAAGAAAESGQSASDQSDQSTGQGTEKSEKSSEKSSDQSSEKTAFASGDKTTDQTADRSGKKNDRGGDKKTGRAAASETTKKGKTKASATD